MAVKNEGLPDLEGYLEERGRHLVTYTEGAKECTTSLIILLSVWQRKLRQIFLFEEPQLLMLILSRII